MQTSAPIGRVLILGGTAEGRELATVLTDAGIAVISSLAGRVSAPRLPTGPVRIGGFGGPAGLTEYLQTEGISVVVDATHPFADRITGNAVTACTTTGIPLLLLRRPAWTATDGDTWLPASDLADAAAKVSQYPPDTAVLLTTGRQQADVFAGAVQRFWLRAVDPPDCARPARCELILDRGPYTVAGEQELLHRLGIDLLVTKNSGGPMTSAKLTAARRLGIAVIMIERPPRPDRAIMVDDVPAAVQWTLNQLNQLN